MKDIERQVSEWNAVILTRSIECELQQPPRNNLRIGKGGFRRRRRHVVLSDIIEQIKYRRFILEFIQTSGSSLVIKIQENISVSKVQIMQNSSVPWSVNFEQSVMVRFLP